MSSFCIHIFFSKNNSVYAVFNDQSFNDMLTNDMVSFEQLGPDIYLFFFNEKKGVTLLKYPQHADWDNISTVW